MTADETNCIFRFLLLQQKNKEGKWTTFATDTLRRP
jgi:hypothetical protein